jgi:hypothetical protein
MYERFAFMLASIECGAKDENVLKKKFEDVNI